LHYYTRNYFLEAKKVSVYACTVVFKIVSPSSDNFWVEATEVPNSGLVVFK